MLDRVYHAAGPVCQLGLVLLYTYMSPPDLYCFQLSYSMPYDPEDVWELVQRHGGSMSVLHSGYYEFYVSERYLSFVIMAFPLLTRQPQKDLYISDNRNPGLPF